MFIRGKDVYISWLGDSQAMISRNGVSIEGICNPHKPEREDEKKRIEDSGGIVLHYGAWRVNGVLSVARAIAENFAVLACDGLWDVLDGESVISFIKEHLSNPEKSIPEVARALVKHAFTL
eukprot:Awhi_evm1s3241